jgi:hypothetical protein
VVANQSASAYSGVQGTLSSSSSYVTFYSSSGSFGTIPAGGSVTNSRTNFYFALASSTPTGAEIPFTLQLQDGSGNTRTLNFTLICMAQLSTFTVTPKIGAPGTPVTFCANYVNGNDQPDSGGIASVSLRVYDSDASETNVVALAASGAGVFTASWTPSRKDDWMTDYCISASDGYATTQTCVSGGGFSSQPYDGTADVLLFNDYGVRPYWSSAIYQAVTNVGLSCFSWELYYRGTLSTGVLAQQRSESVFYYAPSWPELSNTSQVAIISNFLRDGGRMLMAGAYVAYDLTSYLAPVGIEFLADSFGVSWLGHLSGMSSSSGCYTNILGVTNDPLGSGLTLRMSSWYVAQDEIAPVNGGSACFRYHPASAVGSPALVDQGIAGVRTSNTVFLAWDPYMLYQASLTNCLKRALNYLGLDGRGIIQLDASACTVAESAGTVSVTASRVGGRNGAVTVHYATADGSATAPDDYTAVSGTLSWASGATNSFAISIPIVDDSLVQGLKTFTLALSEVSGATLGLRRQATITIRENDPRPVPADFDGDGKADPATHSNGNWLVWFSGAGYGRGGPYALGVSDTDWAAAGDLDGDARADAAVCAPDTGAWYVWLSGQNYQSAGPYQVGIANATALAADFDGDRRADPAAFLAASGQWYIWLSSASYVQQGPYSFGSGGTTDTPLPADYDGDGKADPAVYVSSGSQLYVWFSGSGYARSGPYALTLPAGTPAAADFDGDGKADPMIYKSDTGYWYFMLSGNQYAGYSTRL